MIDYGPAFLMLVALGAVNFWGVVYLGSYAMRWSAADLQPVRREWLDDDDAFRFTVETPAGHIEARQYVPMPDGSRPLFPPLPDGVEELEVEAWLDSIWHSRNDPPRSPYAITLSEQGAARHPLAKRWSKDQVAEVKQWAIDRGWFAVTNETRGNTRLTGWGRQALSTMAAPDGPALRVVACLTPPPSDGPMPNVTELVESRTDFSRRSRRDFVPTPVGGITNRRVEARDRG